MIDFAYRSTHEMTVKAKEIIKAFYSRNAEYVYFKGCSTGGRQALMEAQRYPDDYDGIIAGSCANRHIHMWTATVAQSADLYRHPERNLTEGKASLVNQMVMNTRDTLKEGFLNNPRQCNVNFSKLLCAGDKDDDTCLTTEQLKTVQTFYGGVKNSKGELIFSGQALGNPISASQDTNQGPGVVFDIVRIALNDPDLDWRKFDLDRDMPLIDKAVGYVDSWESEEMVLHVLSVPIHNSQII
jgi:feruloyl esterase